MYIILEKVNILSLLVCCFAKLFVMNSVGFMYLFCIFFSVNGICFIKYYSIKTKDTPII